MRRSLKVIIIGSIDDILPTSTSVALRILLHICCAAVAKEVEPCQRDQTKRSYQRKWPSLFYIWIYERKPLSINERQVCLYFTKSVLFPITSSLGSLDPFIMSHSTASRVCHSQSESKLISCYLYNLKKNHLWQSHHFSGVIS